jgi:hypothetical protein
LSLHKTKPSVSLIITAKLLIVGAALLMVCAFSLALRASGQEAAQSKPAPRDPKAWGGNHVGQPSPEYLQGDECLFCHRNEIGAAWRENAHGKTIRQREDAPELAKMLAAQPALAAAAKQIEYFLGSRQRVRFLKKEGYGKFAILNAMAILGEIGTTKAAAPAPVKITDAEKLIWDKDKFANRCAGCHATAIEPATKTFSAFGHDCYVCHGNVDLKHTNDNALVLLSKKRRNDAKVITSLCAQCHLRGAVSNSTSLPYPNNFIAGDNLFQDLKVDWAQADDEKMNPGDRHVWRNVREVALYGNETITCLSCHQVHANTSFKHRRVLRASICTECHEGEGFKNVKRYAVHSGLCEY